MPLPVPSLPGRRLHRSEVPTDGDRFGPLLAPDVQRLGREGELDVELGCEVDGVDAEPVPARAVRSPCPA